ncbi:MAG: transposase mutator type [Acidobacteriaceae bacterium]|jgi:putative transposase|nr:transposase mutator type [Acidobacteriaceae bacterium]
MATDPKPSVSPNSPAASLPMEVEQALAGGLGNYTLRELLGWMLSSLGVAERQAYLQRARQDKPNGFYDRALQVGTVPVEVRVPRSRVGDFRPASLPPPYQRGYAEETQALLLSLLASARSLNAVQDALEKMGLSRSQQELERVATDLIDELELRNSRPLDCDLLALFLDGKYVEFRDGDRLRPACIYVVVGLDRGGRKQVLTCRPRPGRENLEDWKLVLRGLLERGLRRVLLVVHDDFSGLLPITQSLFPQADVQLCVVHMQRNARNHLSKPDNAEFQQRWRALKSCWNLEVGNQQFEQLCERFGKTYPSFIAELHKKRQHYLAFLAYPEAIRRSLSTTNVVEALNGQLEIMRRNSGGYFHSEDTLKLKLGLAIASLENRCWKSPGRAICAVLAQFNAMFRSRFEDAL